MQRGDTPHAASNKRRPRTGTAIYELCPMAMLFVRCRDGASHLPEEFASEADMEVARQTLSQLVRNLADKYG